MIRIYKRFDEIQNIEKVVDLISEQMDFIGSHKAKEVIENTLEKAFSLANVILFVYDKDYPQGFAFVNTSIGLESGGLYYWVNELYVSPNSRKKGIASQILSTIEKHGLENDVNYIALSTADENEKAISLYQKQGFDISKTTWVDKTLKEV